jgi:ATP-dependent DNA helicase RecG
VISSDPGHPLKFADLWEMLERGDESVAIEAKRADEIGKSVLETVCAFANEPGGGGGYPLLGVERAPATGGYTVAGLEDPERIQSDLATQCASVFNIAIRPRMSVEHVDRRSVVAAFIPEVSIQEKPIFVKSRGLPSGAFRRIGATDQHCTEEDVALFYQLRNQGDYEDMMLPGTTLDDFEYRAIAEYRRLRATVNPEARELGYGDEDLLLALGAAVRQQGQVCPTVGGLILFGTPFALRRQFPMLRLDYIRVAGREWVEDPANRYESAVELQDPLLLLASSAIRHVMDDLPKAFALSEGGIYRRDIPEIPYAVVREAIVNALMHQNFRTHQPTQIIRYANRVEVRNPGSSLIAVERLGEPGSWPRNPRIAAVMHDVGLAENKGTGIRLMRQAMRQANLTVPLFDSDRGADRFVVTLLVHHLLSDEDIAWLASLKDCNLTDDEVRILVIVRETGAVNNSMYRDVCQVDTLTATRHLQRLRDLALLEQKGRGSGTYYVPAERFLRSIGEALPVEFNSTGKGPNSTGKDGSSTGKGPVPELPGELAEALGQLGRRSKPSQIRSVVVRLCGWQPLAASQLSALLGRRQTHLVETYLRPMVREGLLQYTHPENPTHPLQAYRSAHGEAESANQ